MKSYFPDINVWVALVYRGHQHHSIAAAWFEKLASVQSVFCRVTQLGFLRLVTNAAVMGAEVKSERYAWDLYDQLRDDNRVSFYSEAEPDRIDAALRTLTASRGVASHQWPDAYLAAFAASADLKLVTFDRGLGRLADGECLLLSSS
ncbi:MAG: TA system VapC family ribonuclease toxin [Candidatus Acidiferrales bacterium]